MHRVKKGFIPILFTLALPIVASAKCSIQWVDHDFNTATPAIQKQVCDSTYDTPAYGIPETTRPIQKPQIKPLRDYSAPPAGTWRCRNESVYEHGRWTTQRLCY